MADLRKADPRNGGPKSLRSFWPPSWWGGSSVPPQNQTPTSAFGLDLQVSGCAPAAATMPWDPGNFPIPKSRDWAALNPGISGLTKFIYLTVFFSTF